MSFRNRLALFFVLIVIVPMLAVTFLLFRLIDESANGQADAAISTRHTFASTLFEDQRELAGAAIKEVAEDRVFTSALQDGDVDRARRRAEQLLESRAIERIVFVKGRETVVRVGDRRAVAPAVRDVVSQKTRKPLGELGVSVIDAETYVENVRRVTGLRAVVLNGDKVLASTLRGVDADRLPTAGGASLTIGDEEYRVQNFDDDAAFAGQRIRVFTLGDPTVDRESTTDEKLFAGGVLLGFFLLAIACAILISRTLQQQIAEFLAAARRLAGGDFSARVPTVGHDEFADLGEEFNKMSRELERRLDELSREKARTQSSMLRLGETVGQNLDRDAMLKAIVDTAVEGVGADAGRACVRMNSSAILEERSRVGNMNGLENAVTSVEAEAMRTGATRETSIGSVYAMANPLRASSGRQDVIGVVSVGRSGRPFTAGDRELFEFLADRAGRSITNVELHETAARESVTDELTGLSNRRAFDDKLATEIERARRFGDDLGFVLMDLDDFGRVNKTYSMLDGDAVLRAVGRVLRESSREIDIPARYGGEELAVILPGTDLDGAYNRAERIREQIAQLRIPRQDGQGTIQVTASCGVAATRGHGVEGKALVNAADGAVKEAKHSGKNKTVRAR